MSKKAVYGLRIRSYPDTDFVSVWLIRSDGAARGSLLFGEVLPAIAEEIVAATGLPVDRQTGHFKTSELPPNAGCVAPSKQRTLFGD